MPARAKREIAERFPVAIVGGGPVGLCCSIMLSRLRVPNVVFERHRSTSIHPKAVALNRRTVEIFRQMGIEDLIEANSAPQEAVGLTGWYTSLAGPTELHGQRIALRKSAAGGARFSTESVVSPCEFAMLAQIYLEPILREVAESYSDADIRFGSAVTNISDPTSDSVRVEFDRGPHGSGAVDAEYVIAADGGRTIGQLLEIDMAGPRDLLEMVSAHFRADLSSHLPDEGLFIRWFVNPDYAGSINSGYLYPLGPWDHNGDCREWVFAWASTPTDPTRFDDAGIRERITRALGLPDLQLSLISVSHWNVQSVVADRFQLGRVFFAGDAAHRIPPWGALGLNTGIMDAQNLTWKIATAVAQPELGHLLDTYQSERRPAAVAVAANALKNLEHHSGVVDRAIGLHPDTPPAQGWAAVARLFSTGPDGDSARAELDNAVKFLDREFHAHGAELGSYYDDGAIIVEPGQPGGCLPDDLLEYVPTSSPGHRLPHAWLEREDGLLSTLDLVHPGRWVLIIDQEARAWNNALTSIDPPLAPFVETVTVGTTPNCSYHCGPDWQRLRGVSATGALLVRPDNVVAWRTTGLPSDPGEALTAALDQLAGVPSRSTRDDGTAMKFVDPGSRPSTMDRSTS